MKQQTAVNVANWLLNLDHITATVPVIVQIGKRTFAGARYSVDFKGDFAERLYLIGEFPPLFCRSGRVCFRTAELEQDWCLTAWFRRIAANAEYDEVHQFGNHVELTLWSELETWASEQCEPKRRRLKMNITEIGPPLSRIKQHDQENQTDADH